MKSPISFPASLSIGARDILPLLGMLFVSSPSKKIRAPAPVNSCFAKPVISIIPTFSRTFLTSSATTGKALERLNVTSSIGSFPDV